MMTETQEQISKVCEDIRLLLIKKNEDYGNSFHEPINIFSRLSAKEGILIRIDDKLKRLKNLTTSEYEANFESIQDTVRDLIGYLILLLVETDDKKEWA